MGLLYSIGNVAFDDAAYQLIMLILMPGYLLLAWLMIGYILANVQAAKYDQYPDYLANVYKRWFVIWLVVGVILAGTYIVLYYGGIIAIQ